MIVTDEKQKYLDLYNSKKEKLLKRNLRNEPKMYFDFTLFYFPEIIEKFEKMPDRYFNFIDEVVDRKPIYEMLFKEGKSKKEILEKLSISNATYYKKLNNLKDNIKAMYVYYAKTGTMKKIEKRK